MQNNNQLIKGRKRAVVESIEHPDGHLKCKIRLLSLWDGIPVDDLPWAEYELPIGARVNDGDFTPCKVGDYVWVRFDEYDSRYPIITGSCYFSPNEIPNLPVETFDGEGVFEHQRTDIQPTPSPVAPHKDRVSTQNNFMIELTHEGAYRCTHKVSGTAWEITKDGELVLHASNDSYHSVGGKFEGEVIGLFKQTVGDNYVLNIAKDKTETIEQNLKIIVRGNATFEVDGVFDIAKAQLVKLLQGAGVVTGACKCAYTGVAHSDYSSKVSAAK